jgi:hypothetical protein
MSDTITWVSGSFIDSHFGQDALVAAERLLQLSRDGRIAGRNLIGSRSRGRRRLQLRVTRWRHGPQMTSRGTDEALHLAQILCRPRVRVLAMRDSCM